MCRGDFIFWAKSPLTNVLLDEVYWTVGNGESITNVYLSPMTFHVTLNRNVPLDGDMDWAIWNNPDPARYFEWLQEHIVLTDKDGKTVVYENKRCVGNPQTTTFTFGFEEIMDPARFQGGTLTILGTEIPLDGLPPVE